MAESAAERKTFSMGTFYAYLTGEDKASQQQEIKDLLGFMTGLEIDSSSEPFATAVSKAWIYEQHPELTGIAGHPEQFGQHVSVIPLPDAVVQEVSAIVAKTSGQAETIKEQAAKISELEKAKADAESKLKDVEAKLSEAEAVLGQDEKKFQVSSGKVDEYLTKVDDLLAKIEEVKKHGVVTAAPGEGGAAPAADSGEGGLVGEGEISDDFGFGSVDSGGDDFGF
ncbi:MAG: hypothetical protein SV487_08315 [Thermodesulfobacteriota bacterium]|nr:hypothetical protein [Thermodesulfobacteriota bacterium]